MALNARRVTIAVTATRIDAADTSNATPRQLRIANAGAAAVILGPATVTATSGYSLAAGANITVELDSTETLYGIVAAATEVVHVLETGM